MSEHDTSLADLSKALEGVHKGFDAFKQKNDERLAEIEKKGAADVVTANELDKINKSIDLHAKRLEDFHLAQKRASRVVVDAGGSTVDLEAKASKWAASSAASFGYGAQAYTADQLDEYKAAQVRYLRKGDRSLTEVETKALSVGGGPDGGYVVHPDMSGKIVKRTFDTSPMRAYASIQTIGTDALEGLYDTEEADAGWVEEAQSRTETDTPKLGKWRIPVHELYANPAATQKIIDDAEIDIEAWLAEKVSSRFARKEASAFVGGSGVGQPRGFLTYADWADEDTYEIGAMGRVKTGVDGGFAAAPSGGDALISTIMTLQSGYRANGVWFMNRKTASQVRQLKDSDGAYLWQPGIALGQPMALLGYPVATFEDMPDIATGSLSMAFGDMAATYQIVDRAGVRVLRDPYTNKPYVHFYTTKRVGGDVLDFAALKLVEFSA